MATMKAVEILGPKEAHLSTSRPLPTLRDDYILIKTTYVALNPTDWKHVDYMAAPGALSGCDYAGVVEEVGSKVTKEWKKGDRVCGMCHGANLLEFEDGAFAEWIVAKGNLQIRTPEGLKDEEAATLGVGIISIGQSLYQSLGLPLPTEPAKDAFPLLIYGGSTATGTLAIQFAKLSGLTVLTTCSPHNTSLVQSYGADAVFDYNAPDCGAQIRTHTSDKLLHAFDCVAAGSSAQICADALSTSESDTKKYSNLLDLASPRDDVEKTTTLAYTAMGEELSFAGIGGPIPPKFPAMPGDLEFAEGFVKTVEGLLQEGKIKPHPSSVRPGGLGGVLDGWQEMREGKVSAVKLVYKVADTA